MKSNIPSLLFLAFICLVSCQNKSENKFDKIEKMNWLIGSWEQKLPEGIITEIWKKENDSTYSGKSFFVIKQDTIHSETIVLSQQKDKLIYSPTVKGQNNDEPVAFTMSNDAENIYTFENSAHDYPQKISYKKISDTSLIATISGKQQGKPSEESFSMTKK
jgi:hypothetical protein